MADENPEPMNPDELPEQSEQPGGFTSARAGRVSNVNQSLFLG